MSPDHRRRQIDQGLASRSRDRWRPPDQKRERGPAGDRTADLKNTDNNSNGTVNSAAAPARQFPTNRGARRFRLIGRLCGAPDADTRWAVLLAHLEKQFDIEPDVMDRALGGIIEAPTARILLYAQVGGAQ